MAQRGRPKKIFTEEKNLKKKVVKYSPNGYDVVTLQPGRYKASELDPIVLKLHKRGVV